MVFNDCNVNNVVDTKYEFSGRGVGSHNKVEFGMSIEKVELFFGGSSASIFSNPLADS